MNALNVDNKKEITDLKSQCRDPGAPQLYEGRSLDHQRSQLQRYELQDHTSPLER